MMADTAMTQQGPSKGVIYYAGLFVLGVIANLAGLFLGYRLGVAINGVLASMGISLGEYTWMLLPFFLAVAFWGIAAAVVIGGSVKKLGRFTGGHMVVTTVLAFTTIIGVNLALAYNAVATFPGLEVKNSFVASQNFDEDRAAQLALGWEASASADGDKLRLVLNGPDGKPAYPSQMEAVLGAATHVRDDQVLEFSHDGTAFVAPIEPLQRGNWNIRIKATAADGTEYRQRLVLYVK